MTPKRIQLSRKAGWHKPEGTIVVARPTRWGNPHTVAEHGRTEAIARYRADLEAGRLRVTVDDVCRFLVGSDLARWCPLDVECHADVLLEVANP